MTFTFREIEQRTLSYLSERKRAQGAVTPGQSIEVLLAVRREVAEEGIVPMPPGRVVTVDPADPRLVAATTGRPVAIGGQVVEPVSSDLQTRLQALSVPAKVALLAVLFLLPLLLAGAFLTLKDGGERAEEDAVVAAVETPTLVVTSSPTAVPSPTLEPTGTPPLQPTSTPYALALTTGSAAPEAHDPASLEIGGFSYVLGTGRVQNGIWQPIGAEWLQGSEVRRVVAIPYELSVAEAVAQLTPGQVLKLRLRSGEIVRYRMQEVQRVQRQQIEVLAGRQPGLVVVLHGEPSAERTVLLAQAVQAAQDAGTFSAGVPEVDVTQGVTSTLPVLSADPVITRTQTVVTDTRTVTNTVAGLRLTVGACRQASRIGSEEPASSHQRFYLCEVTFRGLDEQPGPVSYSDQSLGIAELEEVESAIDWLPAPVRISDALGAGSLAPGSEAAGRVAGLVNRGSGWGQSSEPVLVWEQNGQRFEIRLDP